MKIRLIKCCWFSSLRLACIIIGWYLIIFSILYLAVLPFYQKFDPDPESKDDNDKFYVKYGKYISGPSALLHLVAGVLDLIAIFKEKSLIMLISISIFFIFIVASIPVAIWAILEGAIAMVLNFILSTVINVYLEMILFSYYVDMIAAETRLSLEASDSVQE